KRTRTPRRSSSTTSRSRALRNSFISAPTSSSGRPQFSEEKANRVSASMPRSRQKSMQMLTARAPARWPTMRGRLRRAAQRPLPSMMMAMCRGTLIRKPGAGSSYRHQFLFLRLDHLVHGLDGLVGDLLDLVLAAALLVLADFLFLQQVLDLLVSVAADVADRDLGVLAFLVHHLGQLAASLLGQGGHVDADGGAGGVGGQAQVRGQDRLLDRPDHLLFPGGDGQRAGVADGNGSHLRQRHVGAVVVDLQVVDQGSRGAAGADL